MPIRPSAEGGTDSLAPEWLLLTVPEGAWTRARFADLRRTAGLVITFSVLLCLVGASLIAGGIVRPLGVLSKASERIARGDFDERIPSTRADEIGRLTSTFNGMAAALARHRKELIQAEGFAAVGRLASVVAHEVRNPLNAIRGCVDYLGFKRPEDELVAHHAQIIRQEVETLDAFVRNFLGFSRLPAPKSEATDVADLLRSHIELHLATAAERSIVIDLSAEPGLPPLMLDAGQIGLVVENLVTNAFDAMADGGTLRVSAAQADNQVIVTFADTGEGMAPEVAHQLFTPFFTTKAQGNGIGLATARRIIDMHGGSLDFTTQEGGGTRFVIQLPLERAAVDLAGPAALV